MFKKNIFQLSPSLISNQHDVRAKKIMENANEIRQILEKLLGRFILTIICIMYTYFHQKSARRQAKHIFKVPSILKLVSGVWI
jgi:hypothetical protein